MLSQARKILFKQMGMSAQVDFADKDKVEQIQQPQKKVDSVRVLGHDQITVSTAFKMPKESLSSEPANFAFLSPKEPNKVLKKQHVAVKSKNETQRVLKEQDKFRSYLKDFESSAFSEPKKSTVSTLRSRQKSVLQDHSTFRSRQVSVLEEVNQALDPAVKRL